jgi:PAS domain S-box-containing protein
MGDAFQQASRVARPTSPEELVALAMTVAPGSDAALREAFDHLSAPIYTTDAQGWVTYFNPACIDFAGRTPQLGEDRWCVTWKLHDQDGTPLPHDACPMAVAIREKREVRGAVAVAERPDGTRVLFTPYPTPLLDEAGDIAGAVNILIDVTDHRQAAALRAQALRCRRLARSLTDQRVIDTLVLMAAEYDQKAGSIRAV